MTEKKVMKEVKYPFIKAELLELGEELARATDELREIERRKKQVASDLAADQKRADGNVFLLAKRSRTNTNTARWSASPCTACRGLASKPSGPSMPGWKSSPNR